MIFSAEGVHRGGGRGATIKEKCQTVKDRENQGTGRKWVTRRLSTNRKKKHPGKFSFFHETKHRGYPRGVGGALPVWETTAKLSGGKKGDSLNKERRIEERAIREESREIYVFVGTRRWGGHQAGYKKDSKSVREKKRKKTKRNRTPDRGPHFGWGKKVILDSSG